MAVGPAAAWNCAGFGSLRSPLSRYSGSRAGSRSSRFPAEASLEYYATVARAISRGEGFYGTGLNNYAPIWAGLLLIVDRGSRAAGVSFDGLLRGLLTGVDLLSATLLWRIAALRGQDPWKVAALFLVNPVSIWSTGFQGQFDSLSLLFLLVAIGVTPREKSGAAGWPAIAALTLSIATKQITVLHPILWIRRIRRPVTLLVPYAVTAALFIPFLDEWRAIRDHVLRYGGVPRSYGLSELVLFDARRFSLPVSALCLAGGLWTAWRLRTEADLSRASLVVFLVLLFLAPGFGTQYAVWPLTVGVLSGGTGYFLFTATTMAWTLGSHFGVPGSGRWMGHLVWLSVGFWLLREAGRLTRSRVPAAPEKRP